MTSTYRIEVLDDSGFWIPAPGEATGWTLDEARRAVGGGIIGHNDEPFEADDVRIVDEATGAVVED